MASDRASSATVRPYPDLHSIVVVPWRNASAASRATLARSTSSGAARVAATVVRMPPALYGVPAIRAANSTDRSPAKTRCAWLSTKPGSTARPPRSSRPSASGAVCRGPAYTTTPASTTSAASRTTPSGPSPPGELVTSSAMPSSRRAVTVPPRPRPPAPRAPAPRPPAPRPPAPRPPVLRRPVTAQSRSRRDRRDRPGQRRAGVLPLNLAAPDHDGVDVRGGGGEHHLRRVDPGGARGAQPDADQVGRRAGRDPPGLRPTQAGVTVHRRRPQQRRAVEVAAPQRPQPLVQFHR